MNGLNSFYDPIDGLEKLVNENSVALIAGMAILSIFVRDKEVPPGAPELVVLVVL